MRQEAHEHDPHGHTARRIFYTQLFHSLAH